MGAETGISWTDSTFNPWWGCTAVSPGCDRCYAQALGHRFGMEWGTDAARRTFGEDHWRAPRNWNAAHDAFRRKHGRLRRVFSASMADVFDVDAPTEERERFWTVVRETPHLQWQLLSKRIGNAPRMLPADWGAGYANAGLGQTFVNQPELERDAIKLARVPAAMRFMSLEPLIAEVDVAHINTRHGLFNALTGGTLVIDGVETTLPGVDWIIVGGESGRGARPMDEAWVRKIVAQCAAAGVACFVKQLGGARDKRGALEDLPPDLRVRQFPRSDAAA